MVTFLTWQTGDVAINVDPMDQFVSKTKTNYGSVSLMYRDKHNSIWLPRARNPNAGVPTDI
ncbi:hypothetical protein SAMN06296058_0787 [Pseudoxanthomonas indica]|uniref:Uncharacterized protein n=1 Tax=Pseudoxanthomonas indica TaxID=428993 RepID=A0A1T5JGH8_9GAMM|nr:hypothetical protein SAMN06296058_0787 [Pseudoxanthomonas indica]